MAYTLQSLKPELEQTRPTFDDMALSHTTFNQELEFAMQIFQANTYLLTMEPNSVKNCLVNVALSGLTLNPIMKLAYLVPRKGKCCLDPSFMGLVKIITDTGSVVSIKASVVYANEPFDIELGSNGFVTHKPNLKAGGRGARLGAYSVARLNDGSLHVEWMYESELMGIKSRSEGVKAGKGSPWLTDEDQMCNKTVIKRHWKQLPKSDRAIMAAQGIAFDDDNNGIDFQKEQAERNKLKNDPKSTPNAPQEALATDEDLVSINTLLANEVLGDTLKSGEKNVKKSFLKSHIEKLASEGNLFKSTAENYIKWLNELIKENTPKPE